MDRRIEFLKRKMLKDIQRQWNTIELTEIAGVSVRHLQRIFKVKEEMSLMCWLKNKRLEKAAELLKEPFLNVSEIGGRVGMPSDSHFTRDFKNKYGVTPTAYRKKVWDED